MNKNKINAYHYKFTILLLLSSFLYITFRVIQIIKYSSIETPIKNDSKNLPQENLAKLLIENESNNNGSNFENIRAYHLDCGRKYFSINEIKNIIDLLYENNYNYFELAIGNEGMRFILDSMTINSLGKTYNSNEVKNAINYGNKKYYSCGEKNELTENEMDEIINYARKKNIEIIPLLNSPGHMNAIVKAMNLIIGKNCNFKESNSTIDIKNEIAVDFIKKFLELYINYFHSKNIKFFNIGCDEYANDLGSWGFNYLIENKEYGYLIKYINEIAEMVEKKNMKVILFNDPIYYNNITNFTLNNETIEFKKSIIISYWCNGYASYTPANAKFLLNAGFKILNTNLQWYYIFGEKLNENYLKNVKNNIVHGAGNIPTIGTMVCAWSDHPWIKYEGEEIENIKKQIKYFAEANSYNKYFSKTIS